MSLVLAFGPMTDATIREAIEKRLVIKFNYDGFPRIVEPHVYGVKDGARGLLGYQIGGASRSGGIPEWRRFDLSKVDVVQVTTETFPGPRPTPTGRHSAWDKTLAIVE